MKRLSDNSTMSLFGEEEEKEKAQQQREVSASTKASPSVSAPRALYKAEDYPKVKDSFSYEDYLEMFNGNSAAAYYWWVCHLKNQGLVK